MLYEDPPLQLLAPLGGVLVGGLLHHEGAVAPGDVRVDLRERLAGAGDHLHQQPGGLDAVLAGDVAAHGEAAGGLPADHGVGLGHLRADPLEADGHLVALLAVRLGDPVQQVGGGHVPHDGAGPALPGQQVLVQQHQHLVGADVGAGVVDDAEPVRVAVGGDAEVGAALEHGLAQRGHRPLRRGGHAPAEQRIVPGVDDLDLAAGADQHGLQGGLGDAEHRVEHDLQVRVADHLEVELLDDRVEIPVDRGLLGDELRVAHLVRGQGADVRGVEGRGVGGELVGDL